MSGLLTGDEVVNQLRLDVGRQHPGEALRHLRRLRQIGYVKIGRTICYTQEQVDRFIREHTIDTVGRHAMMSGARDAAGKVGAQ